MHCTEYPLVLNNVSNFLEFSFLPSFSISFFDNKKTVCIYSYDYFYFFMPIKCNIFLTSDDYS